METHRHKPLYYRTILQLVSTDMAQRNKQVKMVALILFLCHIIAIYKYYSVCHLPAFRQHCVFALTILNPEPVHDRMPYTRYCVNSVPPTQNKPIWRYSCSTGLRLGPSHDACVLERKSKTDARAQCTGNSGMRTDSNHAHEGVHHINKQEEQMHDKQRQELRRTTAFYNIKLDIKIVNGFRFYVHLLSFGSL